MLRGFPIIKKYTNGEEFKNVDSHITEIINTIPDARSGEINISVYNKPAGILFEMSYLENHENFIIRSNGRTVVFEDDTEL